MASSIKGGKKKWIPAYQSQNKEILTAEPKHRIGGEGVSSGISLRAHPKSSVQQVRDICLHFVQKCSGKYTDNKMAARYVHQMADEIIKQLSGVSAQISKRENEPEIFQALLDEWNAAFPPSLGVYGTPKAVAAKLTQQDILIQNLEAALADEKDRRERDVQDILRSLDAQLQSARLSGASERRQMTLNLQQTKQHYEDMIAKEQSMRLNEIEQLMENNNTDINQIKNSYETTIASLKTQIDKLSTEAKSNEIAHRENIDALEKGNAKENAKLTTKIVELENKTAELVSTIKELMDESPSGENLQSLDDQKGDGYEESKSGHDHMDKTKKFRDRSDSESSKSQRSGANSMVGTAISQLKQTIRDLHTTVESKESIIADLRKQTAILIESRDYYKRANSESEKLVAALKEALSIQLKTFNKTGSASKTLIATPKVLCHTPHFLGDKSAEKTMTAFNKVGF